MINQRLAFNRFTTTKKYLKVYVPGYYDDTNTWVGDSYKPQVKIRCTPIPYGDRDSGIGGQKLMATDVGERYPAFMRVHSRTEMPMKSILVIYGIDYKIIEVDNLSSAGYYVVIAAKTLET